LSTVLGKKVRMFLWKRAARNAQSAALQSLGAICGETATTSFVHKASAARAAVINLNAKASHLVEAVKRSA
jgi:hypothetical protein